MSDKTLFTIPDHGKEKTPFDQLHFWAYLLKILQDNGGDLPSLRWMDHIKPYLAAEGFDKDKHRMSSEALEMTRYTFQQFFREHGIKKTPTT